METFDLEKFCDAVEIAIEPALERQIGDRHHIYACEVCSGLDQVRALLQPRWIACSERLPEQDSRYAVRWIGDKDRDIDTCDWDAERYRWLTFLQTTTRRITHWMPLPPLPEGEQ